MALINCKECGREISDQAISCPHCGAPVVREIFCQKCGTRIPADTRYCPTCGAAVSGTMSVAAKDKLTAGILAILLGSLGIHYFYLGKATAGILTIVISMCTCGIWSVVMLVQGILMLVMDDRSFYSKYVETDKTFPLF